MKLTPGRSSAPGSTTFDPSTAWNGIESPSASGNGPTGARSTCGAAFRTVIARLVSVVSVPSDALSVTSYRPSSVGMNEKRSRSPFANSAPSRRTTHADETTSKGPVSAVKASRSTWVPSSTVVLPWRTAISALGGSFATASSVCTATITSSSETDSRMV